MTKKHFKAIADAIKETKFINNKAKENFIGDLSVVFQQLNPRFDWNKFYDACMGE